MFDKIALAIAIIGGLNWGSIGIFGFDLVAALFGAGSVGSRIVYTLVGLSALWCITAPPAICKRRASAGSRVPLQASSPRVACRHRRNSPRLSAVSAGVLPGRLAVPGRGRFAVLALRSILCQVRERRLTTEAPCHKKCRL